jgi:hypothetical protein
MWPQISIVSSGILINVYGKNAPFYIVSLYAAIFRNVTLALTEDLLYMNIKIHQIQQYSKCIYKIISCMF